MIAPTRPAAAPALSALLFVACLAPAVARAAEPYALAIPAVGGGERPGLLLAQRAIERSWGPSEDSVYVEIEVPEWRSESLAGALSALVPGAGQLYAGEKRWWWHVLAEVTGWASRAAYRKRAFSLQNDAAAYAGTPAYSDARWSFDRWERATLGDATEMRLLFELDRNVFYDRIARDPAYLAGWAGDAAATRSVFGNLRSHADDRLRYARYASYVVWLNHALSAVDALGLARRHNRPLQERLQLRVRGATQPGDPDVRAALEASF
jgi:hypothetical protein